MQTLYAKEKLNTQNKDGYLESNNCIITWCVGHLVTMSYPEVYDEKYRKWALDTLPFIPDVYKYEVIESVQKQFAIVSGLLNREDVETIYVCTDSGREGEYIYRLVEMQANVTGKKRRRVWIDSQTEEEILRALRAATLQMEVVPMLCGSSFKNKGVQTLLDYVCAFLPSPLDTPAIEGTNPESGVEESRKPSEDEKTAALAFKIATDPYVGRLTFFRE